MLLKPLRDLLFEVQPLPGLDERRKAALPLALFRSTLDHGLGLPLHFANLLRQPFGDARYAVPLHRERKKGRGKGQTPDEEKGRVDDVPVLVQSF